MKEDIQAYRKCSLILAYSIGNRGKIESKTKKEYRSKAKPNVFSVSCSNPKGHHVNMRLNASVRDFPSLDSEGSFDLLAALLELLGALGNPHESFSLHISRRGFPTYPWGEIKRQKKIPS